ncbi:MAG TPA: hypothetical protein VEP90_20625 [Methylomirabilota bacterium]|nr:hypothetical protein [Methylomirabilota bacterium]
MSATDEYELFLNHVYNLAERRQTTTTIYLSVNAALTGAIAFFFKDARLANLDSEISVLVLLFSGVVACSLWRRLISHYSTLMGWWYEQLRVMESRLQNSDKLITKEYQELFLSKKGKGPIGITRYETALTWLFTGIYFIIGFAILVSILLSLH